MSFNRNAAAAFAVSEDPTCAPDPGEAAPLWRMVSRRGGAIATFNPAGEGPPFYCVHPISGGVTNFDTLARALGPEQGFHGVQVPRKKTNAAFATSIEAMARHHVDALVAFQPEGPLVLGGWSAGAILALEMAQQLRERGREVPLLVALDGAPCNTGAGLSRWHPLYSWKLVCNLPGWIRIQLLTKASLTACVQEIARKFAFRLHLALPIRSEQTLNGSAVETLLDTAGLPSDQRGFIRAFYQAMLAYVPRRFEGRVIVYEARIQPLDHLLQVGAAWKQIARQTEIVVLDGNHESIFTAPAAQVFTEHLRERLAELRRPSG